MRYRDDVTDSVLASCTQYGKTVIDEQRSLGIEIQIGLQFQPQLRMLFRYAVLM